MWLTVPYARVVSGQGATGGVSIWEEISGAVRTLTTYPSSTNFCQEPRLFSNIIALQEVE